MDRTNPQVARFAGTLTGLDDDTLAAMANKGLVRRARKDIEKSPPVLLSADDHTVQLERESCTITLADPISKSTCTCGSGSCRHILGSIIYLRESAPPSPAAPAGPSVSDQILALDDKTIASWGTKALAKKAAMILSRGFEVDDSPTPLIRLPSQNITVRLLGPTVDSMVCSCHAPGVCEHKIAAVLAYQSHKSGKPLELPQAMLQSSTGAPRSREEVRDAVADLMCEMIALGLSRVSRITEQRLRTLATSAHGVDLPRLERMLRTLADGVTLALKRDAQASSAALLLSASRIFALCAALNHPTPALVGEHRSVYMPVAGALDLIGLGARQWRTRSGYQGITVFFWSPAANQWTAWTDARPLNTPGFDPVARFDEDGPWPGSANPRHAAQMRWRVTGAHRNGVGRVTSRANTRGVSSGRAAPTDGPLLTDFSRLTDIARQAFAPGLTDRRDHADLVLLAPTTWETANYDPITQEVVRPIRDVEGRALSLILRHSPETDHGLSTLQHIDASKLRAVLGVIRLGQHGFFIEPITLWTDGKAIHLTLDDAHRPTTTPTPTVALDEDPADMTDNEEPATLPNHTPVGRLLTLIETELLTVAESGVEVIRDLSRFRTIAADCASLGLTTCGQAMTHLLHHLDHFRKSTDRDAAHPAAQLLRTAYLTRLATDSAAI